MVQAAVTASPAPDLAAAAHIPHQVGLASPFTEPDTLSAIVWADLTGGDAALLSRANVMAIPAVARQRHLMCGVAARCQLVLIGPDDQPAAEQPAWLTTGHGCLSAYHRILWTIDDLIFHPFSVWRWDENDVPERIPVERWDTDAADRLLIDGQLVNEDDVIVIPGPHEGILNFGGPSLRRMIDNLDAAATAARNPSAYLELHYTGEEPLTSEQKSELISDWAAARKGINGGVALTGRNLEVIEHGTHESHLLIEGRNADAVDASRLVSSPAGMADATTPKASLNYTTAVSRNQEFLDYGAALYMDAVAARLSMDDVCDPGYRIAFDTSNVTALSAPTAPETAQE
jgi:hypothetical protein